MPTTVPAMPYSGASFQQQGHSSAVLQNNACNREHLEHVAAAYAAAVSSQIELQHDQAAAWLAAFPLQSAAVRDDVVMHTFCPAARRALRRVACIPVRSLAEGLRWDLAAPPDIDDKYWRDVKGWELA